MDQNKIIISNKKKFETIKQNFIKDSLSNIHIIADFDGTLTKTNLPGEKFLSIIHLLRSKKYNYLSDDYKQKAEALFAKYHPIEVDSSLDLKFKKQMMEEWWVAHFNLLIESKLKLEYIEKVCMGGDILLKDGCNELFNFLKQNNIPIIIMSASTMGNANEVYLKYNDCLFDNIYFIANHFIFDDNGFAIDYSRPVIHSLNKDETVIKDFPDVFEKVKTRKNIILIGDGMGDIKMADGFDYNNLLKVGFLHEKQEENMEYYKNNYDVVLLEDNSIDFVNKFLKEII